MFLSVPTIDIEILHTLNSTVKPIKSVIWIQEIVISSLGFVLLDKNMIEDDISEAQLSEFCNPLRGDCVSVAVAIREVFGGHPLIFYDSVEQRTVMHATVEIDRRIYDGTGIRNFNFLLDTAVSDSNGKNTIDENMFEYVGDLTKFEIYDERTKNRVVRRFEDSKSSSDKV